MPRSSRVDNIQPAVPSPPQARMRKFGTFLNNSKLKNTIALMLTVTNEYWLVTLYSAIN